MEGYVMTGNCQDNEADTMTDHQFDAILDMVDIILDGCNDIKEAQEKIRRIRKNPEKQPEDDKTQEIKQE